MAETLDQLLRPERAAAMTDRELVGLLAHVWADVELRERFYGSKDFIRDRLRFFGVRGYLTAAERQGILRTLFAGAVPLPRRLRSVQRARGTADDAVDPDPGSS